MIKYITLLILTGTLLSVAPVYADSQEDANRCIEYVVKAGLEVPSYDAMAYVENTLNTCGEYIAQALYEQNVEPTQENMQIIVGYYISHELLDIIRRRHV